MTDAVATPGDPNTGDPTLEDPTSGDPTETGLALRCAGGHGWVERLPLPMDVGVFVRRLKAVAACPTCGAPTFVGWLEGESLGLTAEMSGDRDGRRA